MDTIGALAYASISAFFIGMTNLCRAGKLERFHVIGFSLFVIPACLFTAWLNSWLWKVALCPFGLPELSMAQALLLGATYTQIKFCILEGRRKEP